MRWLLVIGLALGMAGLGAWRLDTASGLGATMTLVAPPSCPAGGGECEVRVEIQGASNLAAYEWLITYDPNVIELRDPPASAISDGGFLDDSGRTVSCPLPILPPAQGLQPGTVRFGCGTIDPGTMPGVSGAGVLSRITFVPVAGGAVDVSFVCAQVADPYSDPTFVDNVPPCVSPITPTGTPGPGGPPPGETPAPTSTPTPRPGETPAPTSTPTPAEPTPIPTPTGPSPTPLPPGLEAVLLVAGCNPVTSSYPDGTPIQTIADAVGPEGNLISLWMWGFDVRGWHAFSSQYVEDSDLEQADLLDVVFVCVHSTGAFVRPEV